jgi:hypothetical protein
MARTAVATTHVPLAPEEALALWANLDRWPVFVDGFAHVLDAPADWPEEGAQLVWQSTAGGRGRVTERVERRAPLALTTRVFEEALRGTQTIRFADDGEGGAAVELSLEYELDTLWRFRIEAEEEMALRAE